MTDAITIAAEQDFAGADLEALRNYCDRIDLKYSKNHNATTLRKMLNAALAEGSVHYGEQFESEADIMSPEDKLVATKKLVSWNLKAQAGWEGRRRMIILHRAMAHESTRPQFMAWGRLHCYVPMGVEVAIPYPIYEILKLTAGNRLTRIRKTDDEGRIYFQDKWVPTQRFMYSDLGVDPETADRPKHMIDMITQLHGLTNGFKGYAPRQLREICHRLMLAVPPELDPEEEVIEMLALIEAKCGLSTGRIDLGVADLAQAATG